MPRAATSQEAASIAIALADWLITSSRVPPAHRDRGVSFDNTFLTFAVPDATPVVGLAGLWRAAPPYSGQRSDGRQNIPNGNWTGSRQYRSPPSPTSSRNASRPIPTCTSTGVANAELHRISNRNTIKPASCAGIMNQQTSRSRRVRALAAHRDAAPCSPLPGSRLGHSVRSP